MAAESPPAYLASRSKDVHRVKVVVLILTILYLVSEIITCYYYPVVFALHFAYLIWDVSRRFQTRNPLRLYNGFLQRCGQPLRLIYTDIKRLLPFQSSQNEIPHPWTDYALLPKLQNDDIRLVLVTRLLHKNVLECEFQTVRLRDKPKYSAISYTWCDTATDPVRDHVVLWWWRAIPVTKSCFEALQAVSTTNGSRSWIDQLCINQADEAEKASQIALMAQIFEGTIVVDVWLGTFPDTQPEVKDLVSRSAKIEDLINMSSKEMLLEIKRHVDHYRSHPSIDNSYNDYSTFELSGASTWNNGGRLNPFAGQDATSYDATLFRGLKLIHTLSNLDRLRGASVDNVIRFDLMNDYITPLLTDQEAWVGLIRVYKSRYFSRRWTIQETTGGTSFSTTPHFGISTVCILDSARLLDRVVCGQESSIAILLGSSFVKLIMTELSNELSLLRNIAFIGNVRYRRKNPHLYTSEIHTLTLQSILMSTNKTNYFSQHDMFYAVRALVNCPETLPTPDYTYTAYEVFKMHLTYLSSDSAQFLDFIMRSGLTNGTQTINDGEIDRELPTWCSPWCPSKPHSLPKRYIVDLNHYFLATARSTSEFAFKRAKQLSASNIGKSDFGLSADHTHLRISGQQYSRITSISPEPFCLGSSSTDLALRGLTADFNFIDTWLTTDANVNWAHERAVFNTLIESSRKMLDPNPRYSFEGISRAKQLSFDNWYISPKTVWESLEYLLALYHTFSEEAALGHVYKIPGHFLAQYQELLPRRRLAILTNGTMGIVPDVAREGDIVAVFGSFAVPMVIREKSPGADVDRNSAPEDMFDYKDRYQVVGDSFVTQIADTAFDAPSQYFVLI